MRLKENYDMGNKSGEKKIIPKSVISAATCNYARPNNAKACVKRLKELGLTEIIVWNNKAKPIKSATKNIVSATNVGSIGRYYISLHTQKPYILIVDDDHMLTRSGLTALRVWAANIRLCFNVERFLTPLSKDISIER